MAHIGIVESSRVESSRVESSWVGPNGRQYGAPLGEGRVIPVSFAMLPKDGQRAFV